MRWTVIVPLLFQFTSFHPTGGSINGTVYFDEGSEYTDTTVAPSSSYAYYLQDVSFHGVSSAQTAVNVNTPPLNFIDPRRTGLKPFGAYWGSQGEQIDMASGNLNYTIPLFSAMGRGGWSVPFVLSYNSQQWRQDGAGIWKMGVDVGYGFGWRLMAGSLTPYWHQGSWSVDHYLYIDATGAEYRLYPRSKGATIWSSQLVASTDTTNGKPQSGEGIYVYYDSIANVLQFKDGSFWVMGCTSGGTEQDGGTMYPTIIEDRNGNQVMVRYMAGVNALWPNSSARISEIEDTRGVVNGSNPRRS